MHWCLPRCRIHVFFLSVQCPVEWVDAEHPLVLLYTSGSTGKPKGVVHATGERPARHTIPSVAGQQLHAASVLRRWAAWCWWGTKKFHGATHSTKLDLPAVLPSPPCRRLHGVCGAGGCRQGSWAVKSNKAAACNDHLPLQPAPIPSHLSLYRCWLPLLPGQTTKYVFAVHPGDVFWCTADCGWVTGHSYVTYGERELFLYACPY